MKKIMFNDSYGLTQSVLDGRKTMTRRIAEKNFVEDMDGELCWGGEFKKPRYKVGEVVAVAQSYKDTGNYPESYIIDEFHPNIEFEDGWNNKMFVRADLMPHRIRIKNVKVERLQDISDEDCLREGIIGYTCCLYEFRGECYSFPFDKAKMGTHKTPVEAFAALIDKVSGKGTWESNPWVWVYEFELVQ